MRIFYLLTIFLILQYADLSAQQVKLHPFRIDGRINADTGMVKLEIVADPSYYGSKNPSNLSARISNRKFVIEGSLPCPQGFYLIFGDKYRSDCFIIEQGAQSITINIDSNEKVPEVDNSIMKNDYADYKNEHKQFTAKSDRLYQKSRDLTAKYHNKIPQEIGANLEKEFRESYSESDRVLLKYTSSHPNSYVAFWHLIRLMNFGYESIFDSVFPKFSDSLKNTYSGRVLSKNLKSGGMISIGKKFPVISGVDVKNQKLNNAVFLKNQYTLIDFWYSHCSPCIAQFPDLRNLYKEYKSRGFEIIGISTDRMGDKKDWKDAIAKYQLLWLQYWDINGEEARRLSINAFPTNFLLDSEGRIIMKDLRPPELAEFLSEHIKLNKGN